jgi:hypothetical protein
MGNRPFEHRISHRATVNPKKVLCRSRVAKGERPSKESGRPRPDRKTVRCPGQPFAGDPAESPIISIADPLKSDWIP